MIKYLLLLALVGVAIWWLRRGRAADKPADTAQAAARDAARKAKAQADAPVPPTPMLACAHCGVHLPQAEAVADAAGRTFCGEAHRLAGPR